MIKFIRNEYSINLENENTRSLVTTLITEVNMKRNKKDFINTKADTKIVLAGYWLVLMILYVYCDIFSFYRTGQIENILNGKMGFLDVNQFTLVIASILMIIPTLMIGLCLLLPACLNRLINIIIGIAYFIVNIGNIASETWAYYFIFGLIEILTIAVIITTAIKWPTHK